MAINIDSFKHSFNVLDSNLHDKLFEVINSEKTRIATGIDERIHDQFNIGGDYIETFIEDHLIQPLEYFQNTLADMVVDKIDTISNIVSKDSDEIDERKASSKLAVLINEIARNYRGAELESIKNDFMASLPSFLYRHGSQDFLSTEADEEKVQEVRYEVNKYLNQVFETLIESNRTTIKETTTTYRDSLTFDKKVELTPEDLKNRMFAGMMSSYRIKTVDDKVVFANQYTDEVFPLTKKGDNVFVSLDGYLEYTYGEKTWSFREGRKVITSSTEYVALGTTDNPYSMQINFGFDKVDFLYNGKKTEDSEVIKYICEEFKSKAPVLYEKQLSKNSSLTESYEKASQVSQANEKFIIDENNKVRINNENKRELDSYLAAIGYTVEEKEDGIYLTDSDGIARKATISGSNITLPDSIHIAIDLYRFLEKGAVQGPEIYYANQQKNITSYIKTDFSKISLFIGKDLYSVRVNSGMIEARASIGNEKISDVDLITSKIREVLPVAINKMQELVSNKELKGEASLDEEIVSSNASQFLTDGDIAKKKFGVDERTKEEIHAANAAAFLDDGPSSEISSKYTDMLSEVEATPDEVIQEGYTAISNEEDMSLSQIDDRIFELSQDPKVQEYIALMKKAEELRNAQNMGESLGPILI